MPEHKQSQQTSESKSTFQKNPAPTIKTPVSNPTAIIQRARMNPKSLTPSDVLQLQRTIGNRAVGKLLSEIGLISSKAKQIPPVQRQELVQHQEILEEEEPLQGKFESGPKKEIRPQCIQRQEIPEEEELLQTKIENNTGMPDNLKAGVENLSGIDMSDVRVHYNSSKPDEVGALAYTQGTDIHVAPGQERHLPHESWHVVQQKQGRVKPTFQMKDVAVNDEVGLENEADVIGSRAEQIKKEESIHLHHKTYRNYQNLNDTIIQKMKFDKQGNTITDPAISEYEYDTEGDLKNFECVPISIIEKMIKAMGLEMEVDRRFGKPDEKKLKVLEILKVRQFGHEIQEKIAIPLKTADHKAVENLEELIKLYPYNDENKWKWDYFNQDGYTPQKEYPGPIWMWPLQASGTLPEPSVEMEEWLEWKSEEDKVQLKKLWNLAQDLAKACIPIGAPKVLISLPESQRKWLESSYMDRIIDLKTNPLYPPITISRRLKSIKGIRLHLINEFNVNQASIPDISLKEIMEARLKIQTGKTPEATPEVHLDPEPGEYGF